MGLQYFKIDITHHINIKSTKHYCHTPTVSWLPTCRDSPAQPPGPPTPPRPQCARAVDQHGCSAVQSAQCTQQCLRSWAPLKPHSLWRAAHTTVLPTCCAYAATTCESHIYHKSNTSANHAHIFIPHPVGMQCMHSHIYNTPATALPDRHHPNTTHLAHSFPMSGCCSPPPRPCHCVHLKSNSKAQPLFPGVPWQLSSGPHDVPRSQLCLRSVTVLSWRKLTS